MSFYNSAILVVSAQTGCDARFLKIFQGRTVFFPRLLFATLVTLTIRTARRQLSRRAQFSSTVMAVTVV
jgi:hypothetical protein